VRTTRSSLKPFLLLLASTAVVSAQTAVGVLTHHNNNGRTGANLTETVLTTNNVNRATFGKLAYRIVDGNVSAQPLVASGITVGNSTKNIAIVATENNSVYAFDADDTNQGSTTAQLWHRNLGPAIDYLPLYTSLGNGGCTDITLQIGITATPVVVTKTANGLHTGVVFVTSKSQTGGIYTYKLIALDLRDGHVVSTVNIHGDVPGTGAGATGSGANSRIVFSPKLQLNRPALLLNDNALYIAFGGHCDTGNYHGWVFSYDVSNPAAPARSGVLCTTPNGKGPRFNGEIVEGLGGIWMSGEGPAADAAGNIYVATGNGSFDGKTEFGDSVLKLKQDGGRLKVLDWFTPQNQDVLKDHDYDLGSGGVALIPGTHLAIAGGKEGRLYLLDTDRLGKGMTGSLRSLQVTHDPVVLHSLGYNIHGTPVVWARDNDIFIYLMGEEDPLKQYRLVRDASAEGAGWKFEGDTPYRASAITAPYPNYPAGVFSPTRHDAVWMPGGFVSLSADGTKDGSGVLWVTMPFDDNGNKKVVRGVLRAFHASDVSLPELWNSESTGRDNDRLGQFAKFAPPTVANGKVYVGTFQAETILENNHHVKATLGDQPALVIYGLLANHQ
jgi:hypothetical protein